MKSFSLDPTLAGILALGCAAAVVLGIAFDANAGLGPPAVVAAPAVAGLATGTAQP